MLYIIGVNHGIQYPLNSERSQYINEELGQFLEYVKTQISTIKDVSFIAEEMSTDGMKKRYIHSTLLRDFIENQRPDSFSLQHIFIDPSIEERKNLSIPINDKSSFEKSELFWISKIQSKLNIDESGLVIIGLDHIETFAVLLEFRKIKYKILTPKWSPDPSV